MQMIFLLILKELRVLETKGNILYRQAVLLLEVNSHVIANTSDGFHHTADK